MTSTQLKPKEKEQKPVLTGQRLRSRKRDLKEKYDPAAFRSFVLAGLIEAEGDLEKASKFLDLEGGAQDYRRYADTLFDLLIAGGILAPGGGILQDGAELNNLSVFYTDVSDDAQKAHAQLMRDLIRRYKYLQISLEESMVKILKFVKGFEPEHITKLGKATAHYMSLGIISAKPLEGLLIDVVVKNGMALNFITAMFQVWFKNAPAVSVTSTLRKAGLDSKIMDFFPSGKRTPGYFMEHCLQAGDLAELITLQNSQATSEAKHTLAQEVTDMLEGPNSHAEIIAHMKEAGPKANLTAADLVTLAWDCVMGLVDWSKKVDLIAETSLKHIKTHIDIFQAFTGDNSDVQVQLMVTIQNYVYANQIFLKIFNKIILLLYKADVLEEDSVHEWYTTSHSPKGKSVFLEQMKEMIDWLKSAEEEEEDEED